MMNQSFLKKIRRNGVLPAVLVLLFNAIGVDLALARNAKLERLASIKDTTVTYATSDRPIVEYAGHRQGKMTLLVGNNGTFGTEGDTHLDVLTGNSYPACVYPKNSDLVYLWVAALWVGAVVGRDTAVSVGSEDWYCAHEFWPDLPPFGEFEFQSIDNSSPHYSEDAYSEQDIICQYTDTISDRNVTDPDECDPGFHIPLNIKSTQRSMAWSYDYADDFILFDYEIENIGLERLREVYMGIWVDGDVWHVNNQNSDHWTDDLVGFYRSHPAPEGCGFVDTVNIAYHTDNDGDPIDGQWNEESPRSAIGVRVVRTPSDSLKYSYNWWIVTYGDASRDFGPRQKETPDDPFRDLDGRLGPPVGDENKYYVLKHDEFDYDLLYVAIDHGDSGRGWLPPPENAENLADGYDVRNLLSFGPFDIDPGEKLPISFAWIGGENAHVNPNDFESFDPYEPALFYNKLDFSPLALNSRWASWIYDNPGVDTDGDGDSGQYRICCQDTTVTDTGLVFGSCDTSWHKGDGVPDFRGASPPPAPEVRIDPDVGALNVRFNGLETETTEDYFAKEVDFEGYRIYLSRDDRASSFSMVASYDREDFNKYVWTTEEQTFRLYDIPFTRAELQSLYGDPIGIENFDPLVFGQHNPYRHPDHPDSVYYFVPQDFNQFEFGVTTPICRVYPDEPYPSTLNPQDAQPGELTEDGRLKYFEYETRIDNVLPTVPYYVSVTSFDFGSPEIGMAPLESSVLNNAQLAYPLASVEDVLDQNLKVYVYPNPYRGDARYDLNGFENRHGTESEDRMRRIHFANLPPVCTISIFSLDGDLVRRIDHNFPEGGPEAMHDTWNLITRNTQAAVSGLYYWVVESEQGTQMGKLVIIK